MLLVGDINETLYSLHDHLAEEFQIQICSEDGNNVRDMVRLFRPSIVVILTNEVNSDIEDIFRVLTKSNGDIPVVVVGTKEYRKQLKEYVAELTQVSLMFRPVSSEDVCKECLAILNRPVKPNAEPTIIIKKKILIVDDNALVLRNIKSLLEEQYNVFLANSGEKALKLVQKEDIDVILLDYEMPGMSGKEVFEALLDDEKTKNIPVIFLTAVAEREQIYAVLKNKPFGYILKPPVSEEIKRVLNEALADEQ